MKPETMFENYLKENNLENQNLNYQVWHFCNNEEDANELAQLVKEGVKTATSSDAWSYNEDMESLPEVGGLSIITDWDGNAVCIIRTTSLSVVPFCKVSANHAYMEGEGDRSLDFWREAHENFFRESLKEENLRFTHEMPVICETFEVVYK